MVAPAVMQRQQEPRVTSSRKAHRKRGRRTLAERIARHYWRIASQQRGFENIALCFRDQPALLPIQCSEAVARLDALRRTARHACLYLCDLDSETTRLLRPYACIDKLTTLDYQLTEIILCVAMLAPVCQEVCYERVDLHLHLRSLFPRAAAVFEDTISQLAALMDTDRSRQVSQEGRRL